MPKKITKDKVKLTESLEEKVSDANEANLEEEDAASNLEMDNSTTDSFETTENPSTMDIMKAIRSFKQDFHVEMSGVMAAIKSVQSDIKDCSGRVTEAEQRISTAEDDINLLQKSVKNLEKKTQLLSSKVEDLECRSRRNNVRILGIPEKEEGSDPRSYMEKWIADNLDIPSPVLERAHRITSQKPDSAPRTFIVKCLNYKDKESILRAARGKKEVMYKENKIRFLPDLSTEVYKQQRQYDLVRKKLRDMGIQKHRIIYPARLLLTNGERTTVFNTPADVEKYIAEQGIAT